MKITFDTADIRPSANTLGDLLNIFMTQNGGHPSLRVTAVTEGWTLASETPRPLMVAVMGDAIYEEGAKAIHIRHDATNLQVVWYVDGDMSLAYHMSDDDDPGQGFTIVNSHGGYGDTWKHDDLIDARNDPAHDPWAYDEGAQPCG